MTLLLNKWSILSWMMMDDYFDVIRCPEPYLLLFAHPSLGCIVSTLTTPLFASCLRVCNPNFKGVEENVHRVPSYDSTIVKVKIILEVIEILRRTMGVLSSSLTCLQCQEWKARQVLWGVMKQRWQWCFTWFIVGWQVIASTMDFSENGIDYVEGGFMKDNKTLEQFTNATDLFHVTCIEHGDIASSIYSHSVMTQMTVGKLLHVRMLDHHKDSKHIFHFILLFEYNCYELKNCELVTQIG